MKTMKLKKSYVITLTTLTLICPSIASSANWMEDYFNSAGAAMNVTPSAIYQTQSQNVMSMGGFSYRAPQRSFSPFSFSPPGYRAGCGGIDTWLGAYGFANKDQFVAALRNIGQNATGYFFQLALKTMAPEIDAVLSDISRKIQDLNQLQVNSCQTIKNMFGNPTSLKDIDWQETAKGFGSSITGAFSDWFSGSEAIKTDPETTNNTIKDTCAASSVLCSDSDGNLILKRDSNLVFDSLRRIGGYTDDEIEFYISMIGTVVFKGSNGSNTANFSTEYLKPTADWEDFVGKLDTNSTIKVRKCDDYDACLSMSSDTAVTHESFKGFAKITYDALNHIADSIVSRTPVTDDADGLKAMQIIAMTSVPIYTMIADSITTGHGKTAVTSQIINLFSETIATEIAYHHLMDLSKEVNEAINTYKTATFKADSTQLELIQRNIGEIARKATDTFNQKQEYVAKRYQSINTQLAIQKVMFQGLGKDLTANYDWQKANGI